MAQNVYESLVILDSNRYAQDPNGMAALIPGMIVKAGGEVLVSRLWQEQKLAYPIDGHKKGTYWLTYFRMEGTSFDGLKQAMRIQDGIVRELTIKIDPRMVDALVEHAGGGARQTEETPAEVPVGAEA